jgi:sugar fermentation stimulation protein A
MRLFSPDREGRFVDRPNRFVARVETGGHILRVHCANPGRMSELLLPGRPVILERGTAAGRQNPYTLAAVRRGGSVVPLISSRANNLAEELVLPRLYPDALRVRREVSRGASRFDFLVELPGEDVYVEVKACTLVEEGLALFPDAPSLRAARHVRELAELSGACGGRATGARTCRGAVLFVIFSPGVRSFMPNVHTDPGFAAAFREHAPDLAVHAVAVRTRGDGGAALTSLDVPVEWDALGRLAADSGVYLLVLEVAGLVTIPVGSLGEVAFPGGWYVYVGSARRGLAARLSRHERAVRQKSFHWHVDHLRARAVAARALPIRTDRDLECRLAADITAISAAAVPGFGCTDCACHSHLFRFAADPLSDPRFLRVFARYRHRLALGR